jgi:Skp family chaperone for outer membrane proteins
MKAVSRFLVIALFMTVSFAAANSVFAAAEKIGYMDFAKVFDEYNKTKDFDSSSRPREPLSRAKGTSSSPR